MQEICKSFIQADKMVKTINEEIEDFRYDEEIKKTCKKERKYWVNICFRQFMNFGKLQKQDGKVLMKLCERSALHKLKKLYKTDPHSNEDIENGNVSITNSKDYYTQYISAEYNDAIDWNKINKKLTNWIYFEYIKNSLRA